MINPENGQEFYDPRRKTGWPTIWLPQDVGGISGEHVDWIPAEPADAAPQTILFAIKMAEVAA